MRRHEKTHAGARRASFLESVSFGGVSVMASMAISLVSSVAIARLYGVETLGRFALATAPAAALGYLSTAQEQVALVRRVSVLAPRAPAITGLFAAVVSFSLALTAVMSSAVLAVTYLVFRGPIDQPDLFMPAVVSIAGYLFLNNFSWNIDLLLTAFRAGRELFWARMGQQLMFLCGAVGAATFTDSVYGLVGATVASAAISLLHRVLFVRRFLRIRVTQAQLREGFRALPEMVRFGLKLAPAGIAFGVSSQVGVWLIGSFSSLATVGAYNRATNVAFRFMDVAYRLGEVLLPTLFERRERNDHAGFDKAAIDTVRVSAATLLLPAAALGGAAEGIMAIFGPGFSAAAMALAILLLGPCISAMSFALSQVLIATGRPGTTALITVLRCTVTVAISPPLIIWLGATGAALGFVFGGVIELVLQAHLARRELATPLLQLWGPRQLMAQFAALPVGTLASWLVDQVMAGPVGLLAALASGTLAYILVFVLLGGVTPEDRSRVRRLTTLASQRFSVS